MYQSKINEARSTDNLKGGSTKYEGKNYNQYNLQNLAYEIVKEYSHFKADKNSDFMKRMVFDIFKRQTKESRINQLIEINKVKIDENERVQTFNRLIDDANRRIEAQERLEELKEKLNDGRQTISKKYNQSQWDHVYDYRFKKFIEEKIKNLNEVIEQRLKKEAIEEETLLQANKPKRAPQQLIDASVTRMYADAERRKLKLSTNLNKKFEEKGFEKGKIKEGEELDNKAEAKASDFKPKTKKQTKYNFISDGEKSDEEKVKIFKKAEDRPPKVKESSLIKLNGEKPQKPFTVKPASKVSGQSISNKRSSLSKSKEKENSASKSRSKIKPQIQQSKKTN